MSQLFTSFTFPQSTLNLDNRIVIAPMCTYSSIDGFANDWHFQHWSSMLMSSAGLFIIEATAVTPAGRISEADLGIWDDERAQAIKLHLDKARKIANAPVGIQLAHAGRKASTPVPWKSDVKKPWQVVAPSAVRYHDSYPNPVALTINEIEIIIDEFVQAALRAQSIGIDIIEIHAAHGYLLHEFLSPITNLRTDEYGGSLNNRMRLLLEIIDRLNAHPDFKLPIGVRISATDWVEGGFDIEEAIEVAKSIQARSCAYLHVSSAGLSDQQKIPVGPLYQVPLAQAIKQAVPDLPVIAVGLITKPEEAESILTKQQADLIGLARAILYNPRWPWHAAEVLGAKVNAPLQYVRCAPRGRSDLFKPHPDMDISTTNATDALNK
ncbi:NADH:flavin oxidoreductase/NADH oxidase [Thorsellia anophelis]|uniref:2,4-dienoyl-CoA reductase n=1 Tax=Thorsellia anophelis DSM 18579 TaxID=1123402 RepID=A0A1I0EA72_9GAMM|nr:NADH:flavin oxidoreductase/NADH oxidase [Thorsellia anophelis]SET41932.1 2,4-dienoyl-CoA reductase [Thorsellia anophelis DSM 18579]